MQSYKPNTGMSEAEFHEAMLSEIHGTEAPLDRAGDGTGRFHCVGGFAAEARTARFAIFSRPWLYGCACDPAGSVVNPDDAEPAHFRATTAEPALSGLVEVHRLPLAG